MKTRGIAGLLAILLAGLATTAVYLYVKGLKQEDRTSAQSVQVVVSHSDISAGTALDPLIDQGQFELKAFPAPTLVQGAVTSLEQLRGRTTTSGILAGEQVSLARLQGSTARTGGQLGIKDGYQALTLSLDAPHAGGGYIQQGDHITIYAEGDVSFVKGRFDKLLGQTTQVPTTDIGEWAFTVVPDVRVLRVFNAASNTASTGVEGSAANLQITLELLPADVPRVMLASEQFSMWLGLLPPGQAGEKPLPVNAADAAVRGKL